MATACKNVNSTITDAINKRIRYDSKIILDQKDPIIHEGTILVVVDAEGNNFLMVGEGNKYSETPIAIIDREKEIKELNEKITDIVQVLRDFNKILYVIWATIILLFIIVIFILVFK